MHAKVNGHITNVISYGCNTEGSRRQTFRRETWKSISQLGSGGAGTVWLEENTAQVGRFRAVKVVSKSLPVDYKRELVAAAVLSKVHTFESNGIII